MSIDNFAEHLDDYRTSGYPNHEKIRNLLVSFLERNRTDITYNLDESIIDQINGESMIYYALFKRIIDELGERSYSNDIKLKRAIISNLSNQVISEIMEEFVRYSKFPKDLNMIVLGYY